MLANPIGLFKMSDEKGPDDHVVCVPCDDPGCNEVSDVSELPAQLRGEIGHFFSDYEHLDPAWHSEVEAWSDRDAAVDAISEARARFKGRGH